MIPHLTTGTRFNHQFRPWIVRGSARGFALVITLALLILITIVAVGLLSLSSIALRASAQTEAVGTARANARLALHLALGELQKQAGPDTRVTARADILDEKNPPVLGVWRSWQGDDHETSGNFPGRPKSPGSDYRSAKESRFIAWLTSANSSADGSLPDTTNTAGKATLVGPGAVGTGTGREALEIHLTPQTVNNGKQPGAMAWWIGGENQKARLPQPYSPDNDTAARWAVNMKSHATADPLPYRLTPLLDDPEPAAKAITRDEADLIATKGELKTSREFFHDLSAVSVGLLTNTATGGWRKDFSLITEAWSSQPKSGLPLFRLTAAKEVQYTRPVPGGAVPPVSMFYPWAGYRGGDTIPIYQHGAVSSWENLVDYATIYKRIVAGASGRNSIAPFAVAITGDNYSFLHKVRILPVIARVQWVFSHSAGILADPKKLEPRLLVTPVITMWNPYSMELSSPALTFNVPRPLPTALRYAINGVANSRYNSLMAGSDNNTPALSVSSSLGYSINTPFTLKPGETRLFSPKSATPVPAGTSVELSVGYRSGGGNYFPVRDDNGSTLSLPTASTIKADAKFDTVYSDFSSSGVAKGVGIYLDMKKADSADRNLAYRMVFTQEIANVIYKPLTNMAQGSLSQCVTNPSPFLSTIFGARMASRTHLAAKGFVQSSPLIDYTAMGLKDLEEATIKRHYGGTRHPVNSTFDYSFVTHPAGGDSLLPNASDTTGRGYIVTGFNKADGLSRCVIAELPSRPIISLGELVNWDLRYENPIPPYAFNLIGNSDASPLLPPDAVVNSADANLKENLQYDDSYCANHLLFDDWFCSSIAPDPTSFGTSGRIQRKVFTEFVTGQTPLSNRAYQPIPADRATALIDSSSANKLYLDQVAKVSSWRTIASRLEVDGMFNVNSTSVTAWRALLGHARNQRVPYLREAGGAWDVALADKADHVLGRFSIAGDTKAGTPGSSGAFPEATEFAGYREVDERFLDAMAAEVVGQVRMRGPFLSLAEFVNRQLSYGDLALAGTLQAALNNLAKTPSTNPFQALEALSTTAVAVPENAADAEYKFPDAAVGRSAYGLPGWTRQADILRPIAPVLSARDDTFTIRGYGDARDPKGQVLARVVCEAVVRRGRDFVDPAEAADILTPPARTSNKTFGRRFQIVSFRWLAPNEV